MPTLWRCAIASIRLRLVTWILVSLSVSFALSSTVTAKEQTVQDYIDEVRFQAEKGDADAEAKLGLFYRDGRVLPQDNFEAVYWFRKAAGQGNAFAQANLGQMYENGWGVKQDYAEAGRWYRKAAEQGNVYAQANLGTLYYNGKGVPKNYKEAARWYQKAAEGGHDEAQNSLGWMYENGWGVAKDYAEAVHWYQKAIYNGNAEAPKKLEALQAKIAAAKQPAKSEQPQVDHRLAINEVEDLLTGGVSPKRAATLVQQYGVNFELTKRVEERLRKLGADDALLITITKNHR